LEEVADALFKAYFDSVGDERVTDVESMEVWEGEEVGKIGEAKAVAGVDLDF
jgi:hypothetical protein